MRRHEACERRVALPARPHRLGRDLLDVVHQAIQLPLGCHLGLAAQREGAHALVAPNVRKHRLDRGDAPAVQRSAAWRIERIAHALARVGGHRRVGARSAPPGALAWPAGCAGTALAMHKLRNRGHRPRSAVAVLTIGRAVAGQCLAHRATGCLVVLKAEVLGPEEFDRLGRCAALVIQHIALSLVLALPGKPSVAPAHAVVGNQRGDAARV
jgi:hypothetical protein